MCPPQRMLNALFLSIRRSDQKVHAMPYLQNMHNCDIVNYEQCVQYEQTLRSSHFSKSVSPGYRVNWASTAYRERCYRGLPSRTKTVGGQRRSVANWTRQRNEISQHSVCLPGRFHRLDVATCIWCPYLVNLLTCSSTVCRVRATGRSFDAYHC